MKRFVVLGVFGLMGVVSACSGESDDEGGSATDCASAARSLCSKLSSCAEILVTASYTGIDQCAQRVALTCTAQVGAPGSNVGPSEYAACANAISDASCEALFSNTTPAACDLPGTLENGTACGFDTQCKSASCVSTGSACGTCAPVSPAGGSCTSNSDCENGLVCSNGVCAQPVAAGGACTSSGQCSGMLLCKSGTCAQPAGAGEACTPATGGCDVLQGLFCSPFSSQCEKPLVAQAGEPCGRVDNKLQICGGGGSCEGATGSTPGTCVPPAADGAACDDANGPNCLQPAECVSGVCKLPEAC